MWFLLGLLTMAHGNAMAQGDKDRMAKLEFLVGRWILNYHVVRDDAVQLIGQGTGELKFVLDGQFLVFDYQSHVGEEPDRLLLKMTCATDTGVPRERCPTLLVDFHKAPAVDEESEIQ